MVILIAPNLLSFWGIPSACIDHKDDENGKQNKK